MKKLVLLAALVLASCATTAPNVPTVLSMPLDSAVQRQVAQARARDLLTQLTTGRVKFNGPVTLQLGGTGNVASATSADKAKAPVAAGPASTATETRPAAGGAPWWLWVLVPTLAFAGGFVVRGRLKLPGLG